MAGKTLHALFVNEGEAGAAMLGHPRAEDAFRLGLAGRTDVEPRYRSLGPPGRATRLSLGRIPVLGPADLDAQALRWHLVQGLRTRRLVRYELSKRPTDVLHIHSHSIALTLSRELRRVPTALSVDTTIWDWRSMETWRRLRRHSHAFERPVLALERTAFADAAVVLAWTGWAREAVLEVFPGANVVEHHPGLDAETFHPVEREVRQRPRVLFVGGRFEEKGGFDLVTALGRALGKEVDLDVVTPQAPTSRPGLRIHSLAASDPRLVSLYQRADVFCLPTRADTNPWAIIEAMACGGCVVSTRVGAISELLDDGRAGVLVEPRDPDELRRALDELLSDPDRRARLGAAARRRVEERYDVSRQGPELARLLSEIA